MITTENTVSNINSSSVSSGVEQGLIAADKFINRDEDKDKFVQGIENILKNA